MRLDDRPTLPGACSASPGEFLLHVPIPLAEAREAMDAVLAAGFHLNCYVDDLLYVAEVTPEATREARLQLRLELVERRRVADCDELGRVTVEPGAEIADRVDLEAWKSA